VNSDLLRDYLPASNLIQPAIGKIDIYVEGNLWVKFPEIVEVNRILGSARHFTTGSKAKIGGVGNYKSNSG
jgi:hypothetical protein